jgi:serine/threonine protein phosphatase PrpC
MPLTPEGEPPQAETSSLTPPNPSAESPPLFQEKVSLAESSSALVPENTEETVDEGVTQPLQPIRGNFSPPEAQDDSLGQFSSLTSTVSYLDNQQRYRLLEPLLLKQTATDEDMRYGISVRVLDCQPFQKSLLEALIEQQESVLETSEANLRPSSYTPPETGKILGIPAIAQPYLALKELYYQTLPAVHDAWEHEGEAVVLLEDRSEWQSLRELWDSEQLSTLQILYWLDEMAKLWEALEPWHCRQSLLETENLRVDEDQALGLVRLYPEPPTRQLTLQDLGKMWQTLFDQSQRTHFTTLAAVFRQMCTQEIATIQELRSYLEAIAHEQQALVVQSPETDDWAKAPIVSSSSGVVSQESIPTATPRMSQEPTFNNEGDDLPTVILPMQLLSLDDTGCTDIGQQREHNEDSFGIQTLVKKQENPMGRSVQARGLYILCDGMGGHASGEVASGMAVETIKRYFQDNWPEGDQLPSDDCIREAVRVANQAIYEVNQKNARSGSGRMGTTLAMMLIQNTNAVVAHVGDSRLYRLTRKRGLEQITVDHEVGQREIKRGVPPEIAYNRHDAYQLTQALGPRDEHFISPDIQFLELNEDTLFVLCSDGLSDNNLIETHWQTHLAPLLSSRANLDQGILQLIELANEHNGHDNITAILIRVKVRPNFEQQQLLYK